MAYTGRLANPDARPANIKLAVGIAAAPSIPLRPWPDMATTLALAPYVRTVTVGRATAAQIAERNTSVTLDE